MVGVTRRPPRMPRGKVEKTQRPAINGGPSGLLVRLEGFEPTTRGLRIR